MSFSLGLKNEFETAVVNEPSVFEPLEFYCILLGTIHYNIVLDTNRIYDGVETETRKSQARFQII